MLCAMIPSSMAWPIAAGSSAIGDHPQDAQQHPDEKRAPLPARQPPQVAGGAAQVRRAGIRVGQREHRVVHRMPRRHGPKPIYHRGDWSHTGAVDREVRRGSQAGPARSAWHAQGTVTASLP